MTMYFRWFAITVLFAMLVGCTQAGSVAQVTATRVTNIAGLEQSVTTPTPTVVLPSTQPTPSRAIVDVPTRGTTLTEQPTQTKAVSADVNTEPPTQTKMVGAAISDEPATVVVALQVPTGTASPLPAAPHPRPTVVQATLVVAVTSSPLPTVIQQRPTQRPAAVPTSSTAQTSTPAQPASRDQIAPTSPINQRVYLFPVQPASRVSYGTCHHDYPATDIFTPRGSVFVAVTGGVVDFVSYTDTWEPQTDDPVVRGGLSVAIIGDDGIRYYGSHLSEIAPGIRPGIRVAVGQRLGLTGKTGDARFTSAHLHFGISRPTTPDDWRARRGETSPYRYLNAWRRGINLTPVLTQTGEGAC